jgi:TNF receptor-associated protein 1
MGKDQEQIFYSVTPSRSLFDKSPYYEPFKAKGVEVLVSYNTRFDDYVMSSITDYKGKKLINIDSNKAADFLQKIRAKGQCLDFDENSIL